MFRIGSIFLVSVYSLMLKICGLIYRYFSRSKSYLAEEKGSNFSDNHSQKGDEFAYFKNLDLEKSKKSSNSKSEDSAFLQSGLISNSSKSQVMCCENVSGFIEEPKTERFVVHEMFVGPDDHGLVRSDQNLGSQIVSHTKELKKSLELDEESHPSSFYFNLLSNSKMESIVEERDETDHLNSLCSEKEVHEEREEPNLVEDDHDFSYEVELLVADQECDEMLISTRRNEGNESDNWMSNFLDHSQPEESDDEYIELENLGLEMVGSDKESTSSVDANKAEESHEENIVHRLWDSDEDDDEADVLSEHQNLVEQMKTELKNCRIKGLPTISEECESPKMFEDLKPLKIDHKIEYKDIMDEVQTLYKSYSEKMRKLDILNYQTLHAISFLQLKESQVFSFGKEKADLLPLVLQTIWPRKVQRVYADPMHKSINEVHRDLELVYVGQLCLSWEILCWLYVKTRELLEYDSEGKHSYNRAADEFQQFQVLMQRFMEDEPFQGHRNENYVKNRCMIRGLLQVPTIKDDCLKSRKESREETDTISLETLAGIIRESMLIFQEFLFADKRSTNVVQKGIKGTKVDLQDQGDLELLLDIISSLQKKERRMREQLRSENCIVKKMKKHQEWRSDREVLTSQVELRLVSRVLNMSRLTTDQLVWCKNKVGNISFVGRKVHREQSFLLFPC